jgi:serine/threonine protein kinase
MSTKPEIGGRIGRFQIEAEVGHGGMGVVYRAFDPTLGRRVAIKLIAPHLAEDEQALARFRREAAAAAGLRHPGIATVYEFGEHEGAPYIIFEWVEGPTLKAILAEEGPLPLERVLAIFDQLCAALQHAHTHGVVHRDLKPANVIVGSDGRATIVDFGLAWLASAPGITTTGSFFGTPAYMSPEQIQGLALDARSDLYSLAILLYEMLAGRPPFEAPSTAALLHKQAYVPPPPIAEFRRDLPAPIGRALKRALSKEAGRRFPTAEEFAQAVHGDPPSHPQPQQGKPRRLGFLRKKPWVGGGLLAVLSLGVLAVALIPRVSPEPARPPTPKPSVSAETPSEEPPPPEPPEPLEGGLWSSPAGDPAQTGLVPEGFSALDPNRRWFHEESEPHTVVAVGGGMVIFGAQTAESGGTLRALDWATGEVAWEVPLGSDIPSSPVIHPSLGLVYATTDAGELYAFDLAGEWRWMRSAEEMLGVAWGGVTVAPDGSLNLATDRGWIHALEPSTGEFYGSVDLSGSDVFVRRPAVIGSFVLAAGAGGSLQALDRASLQTAWTAWLPSHATTPPVVLEDAGLLFVGEQDGTVQAFTLATGGEVWAWQDDGSTVIGLACDGRRVYTALASGLVVALDPWSGDEAWRAEVSDVPAGAPLTDGNLVLIATGAGDARYLSAETGEEITAMRLSVGEPILGAPAPAGGWLFVSSASGISAFGPPAP